MIRGEKIFTVKARAKYLAACERAAKKKTREAAKFRDLAQRVASAKTAEDLERIRFGISVDVEHAIGIDLLPYVYDSRTQCHYCKKKVHGGCGGLILTKPDVFACWREGCQKKYDRAIAADERANPKVYAAAERKARRARSRERRNEARFMRRRPRRKK